MPSRASPPGEVNRSLPRNPPAPAPKGAHSLGQGLPCSCKALAYCLRLEDSPPMNRPNDILSAQSLELCIIRARSTAT